MSPHVDTRQSRPWIIVGAYGQGNLGDELLLRRCLSFFPKEACIVLSSDPHRTTAEHGVPAMHVRSNPARLLWRILRARGVLIGGGDQWKQLKSATGRKPLSLLIHVLCLALFCRCIGRRIVCVGGGIGTLTAPGARHLARWSIRLLNDVTLRDAHSASLAREWRKGDAHLTADLAFLQLPPQYDGREKSLGIAPALELDRPSVFPHFISHLAQAAAVVQEHGEDVLLLPFQRGGRAQDDVAVCHMLAAHAQSALKMDESLSAYNADDRWRRLGTLWGCRLHSLILSTMHGVPFIALVYDEKVRNFLREVHSEKWGMEIDESFSMERLLVLHAELQEQHEQVREHLRQQALRLHERSRHDERLLMHLASEG